MTPSKRDWKRLARRVDDLEVEAAMARVRIETLKAENEALRQRVNRLEDELTCKALSLHSRADGAESCLCSVMAECLPELPTS